MRTKIATDRRARRLAGWRVGTGWAPAMAGADPAGRQRLARAQPAATADATHRGDPVDPSRAGLLQRGRRRRRRPDRHGRPGLHLARPTPPRAPEPRRLATRRRRRPNAPSAPSTSTPPVNRRPEAERRKVRGTESTRSSGTANRSTAEAEPDVRGGVTHNESLGDASGGGKRRRRPSRRRARPAAATSRWPKSGDGGSPVRGRRRADPRQPDDDDRALRPGADRRPQLRHRLLRDPALPAADLPGLRHRIRDPLGGPGLDQQNRDRLRHQPQRLQRRRGRLDAVPPLELGNVRARRQRRRPQRPLQPGRRDLRRGPLPEDRRRRQGPLRRDPRLQPRRLVRRRRCCSTPAPTAAALRPWSAR